MIGNLLGRLLSLLLLRGIGLPHGGCPRWYPLVLNYQFVDVGWPWSAPPQPVTCRRHSPSQETPVLFYLPSYAVLVGSFWPTLSGSSPSLSCRSVIQKKRVNTPLTCTGIMSFSPHTSIVQPTLDPRIPLIVTLPTPVLSRDNFKTTLSKCHSFGLSYLTEIDLAS